jgi:hypothetical protein
MTTDSEHDDDEKSKNFRGSNEKLALDSYRENIGRGHIQVALGPPTPSPVRWTSQLYTEGRKIQRELRWEPVLNPNKTTAKNGGPLHLLVITDKLVRQSKNREVFEIKQEKGFISQNKLDQQVDII